MSTTSFFTSRRVFMFGLLCFICGSSCVNAAVEFVDSGETYDSEPERKSSSKHGIGWIMDSGKTYRAHLQHLPNTNLDLCQPPPYSWDSQSRDQENWHITVPSDGLPVALFVRKGGCDLKTKAFAASFYIQPPGIVKYLIVDGDENVATDAVQDQFQYETAPNQERPSPDVSNPDMIVSRYMRREDPIVARGFLQPNDSQLSMPSSLANMQGHHDKHDDDNLAVAIMYVSYSAGDALLSTLDSQDLYSRSAGGPKVILSAETKRSNGMQMLMTFTFMFCVLACCACCLVRLNWIWDEAEREYREEQAQRHQAQQEQTRRPRRRKLTKVQVNNCFPVFTLNEIKELVPISSSKINSSHSVLSAHKTEAGEGAASDETDKLLQPDEPEFHAATLDQCSICLDDYDVGNRIQRLPCHHTFHCKCISKWLTQRSATCPLCNIELLKPEEDEEEDTPQQDEEAANNEEAEQEDARGLSRRSGWLSWLSSSFEGTSEGNIETVIASPQNDVENPPPADAEPSTAQTPTETERADPTIAPANEITRAPATTNRRRRNRRNRRNRQRVAAADDATSNDLTEPLLAESQDPDVATNPE